MADVGGVPKKVGILAIFLALERRPHGPGARPAGGLSERRRTASSRRPRSYNARSYPEPPCGTTRMATPTADIGLIGLAVMGENLVLNMESRGYTVAVYN